MILNGWVWINAISLTMLIHKSHSIFLFCYWLQTLEYTTNRSANILPSNYDNYDAAINCYVLWIMANDNNKIYYGIDYRIPQDLIKELKIQHCVLSVYWVCIESVLGVYWYLLSVYWVYWCALNV